MYEAPAEPPERTAGGVRGQAPYTPEELGFGALFERTADAVMVCDDEGRIVLWNPAAERMFGWRAAEALGQPSELVIPPRERPRHSEGLAGWQAGGEGPYVDRDRPLALTAVTKAGNPLEIEMSLSTFEAPRVPGRFLLAIVRDVSERVRLERELRAAETRWRSWLEHAPDLVGMLDPDGTVRFANYQVSAIGFADVVGTNVIEHLPSAYHGRWNDALAKLAGADEPIRLELPACLADGRQRWFLVNLGAIRENGRLTGILITALDVTESHDSLIALQDAADRMAVAARLVRLGTWEWRVDEDRVVWSPEMYAIYGLRPEEFDQTLEGFLERTHPDDRERVRAILGGALRERIPFELDKRIVRPDGEVRYLHTVGDVAVDARGQPTRMQGFCQDMTEMRRAADRKAEDHKQRELDRLKGDLISAVSHEMRTPLTAVRAYAEFLEDEIGGPLSSDQRTFVAELQRGARRLEMLIDDLLDFARIDAGTFRLQIDDADLGAKIREVAEAQAAAAAENHLTLRVELPDEPLPVRMDTRRIAQVLDELVANAVRFTPKGGQIQVQAQRDGDWVRCEVRDSGVGIDPADHPKLFRRFSQLAEGLNRGGTGLGLALCKTIIETHGGRIGVESRPGEGCRFWFTLPAA